MKGKQTNKVYLVGKKGENPNRADVVQERAMAEFRNVMKLQVAAARASTDAQVAANALLLELLPTIGHQAMSVEQPKVDVKGLLALVRKPAKVSINSKPGVTHKSVGCTIAGCDKDQVAKKMCHSHYRKAKREGLVAGVVAGNKAVLKKMTLDGRATRWQKQAKKAA